MQTDTIRLEDHERTRCEVWTRVMGYHRPVSEFNPGKQAEHAERCHFNEPAGLQAAAAESVHASSLATARAASIAHDDAALAV
ncbi:anaerobic ribonucleoside-triphosphate reductase [Rhodocyclus tenuis]|uniref:anaerobic ribonucleoside-triphosphate reductase n=1 Tax=Rhodocyclus tenuis TaxID=1066 RepID=UPI00190379AF|nr:anaerobic ribonucleoside-triphosphate reductase [Rhodocyclus tenuis]MBK1679451.1 hypothetical protein [Rhodocyclus tenuis]